LVKPGEKISRQTKVKRLEKPNIKEGVFLQDRELNLLNNDKIIYNTSNLKVV